jgi:hypothetical protein
VLVVGVGGVVGGRAPGRQRICFLQPEGLKEVADWVGRYEEFWRARLLALDRHVRKRKEG